MIEGGKDSLRKLIDGYEPVDQEDSISHEEALNIASMGEEFISENLELINSGDDKAIEVLLSPEVAPQVNAIWGSLSAGVKNKINKVTRENRGGLTFKQHIDTFL